MILVRLKVGDWEQFWNVFTTEGAERRRDHGSAGVRVLRNQDDQTEAWLLFDWDRARYESFLAEPEVQEMIKKAGAEGQPEVRFVDHVEDLQV